jgi:hypothetical protein
MIVEMFENFNIKLVIYIIVCIIIVAYGSYQVFQHYQGIGAVIFFIGSLYICIIYGIRWFGASTDGVTSWPPTINTCPDYLTYYKRTVNGSSVDTCIDTVGVADQSVLAMYPSDGSTPDDDKFYFSLVTTTSDKNTELCNRAIAAKLTWEGVTNGESCIGSNGQPGSSGSAIPSAGCIKA